MEPLMQPISMRECAKMIGVTRHTIMNWRKRGFGPKFYRVGGVGRKSTTEAEVRRFIKEQERANGMSFK